MLYWLPVWCVWCVCVFYVYGMIWFSLVGFGSVQFNPNRNITNTQQRENGKCVQGNRYYAMLIFWRLAWSRNDSSFTVHQTHSANQPEYNAAMEYSERNLYDKCCCTRIHNLHTMAKSYHRESESFHVEDEAKCSSVLQTNTNTCGLRVQSYTKRDVTNKCWRHPLLSYMIQTGISYRAFLFGFVRFGCLFLFLFLSLQSHFFSLFSKLIFCFLAWFDSLLFCLRIVLVYLAGSIRSSVRVSKHANAF